MADNDSGGGNANSELPVKDSDKFLPIANVRRIMRRALPENALITKEAREAMQKCVSDFVGLVTSEAADKVLREKRRMINGDDLLSSMRTLGLENYVELLRLYLEKYREMEGRDGEKDGDGSEIVVVNSMDDAMIVEQHQGQVSGSVSSSSADGGSRTFGYDEVEEFLYGGMRVGHDQGQVYGSGGGSSSSSSGAGAGGGSGIVGYNVVEDMYGGVMVGRDQGQGYGSGGFNQIGGGGASSSAGAGPGIGVGSGIVGNNVVDMYGRTMIGHDQGLLYGSGGFNQTSGGGGSSSGSAGAGAGGGSGIVGYNAVDMYGQTMVQHDQGLLYGSGGFNQTSGVSSRGGVGGGSEIVDYNLVEEFLYGGMRVGHDQGQVYGSDMLNQTGGGSSSGGAGGGSVIVGNNVVEDTYGGMMDVHDQGQVYGSGGFNQTGGGGGGSNVGNRQ